MTTPSIEISDLSDPAVVALLQTHLEFARSITPGCSGHALNLDDFQDPQITLWVAKLNDEVAGCVALRRLSPEHGEVKTMHTLSSKRRSGVGRALLEHLESAARNAGIGRLSLETGQADGFAPSRALYAAHGFQPCAPFGDYVGDDFSYCMTKLLK